MTQTRHGHHIPETSTKNEINAVPAAPCGGIGSCTTCTKESNKIFDKLHA